MAEKKNQGSTAPVYEGQDGFLRARAYEDEAADRLLQEYAAVLEGYQFQDGESYIAITAKIGFPMADREGNANLWAFFITKALHPAAYKPFIKVYPAAEGFTAYCTFKVWKHVKRMESKQRDNHQW